MEESLKAAIREHAELSARAAEHPRLVQGGGGNCSVKASGRMVVKASGYFLEDVDEKSGYAILDLATGQAECREGERLSLEAPLHTLLGTYVMHTHPIAVGALVCSRQGSAHFKELFAENFYHWIGYAAPGERLYQKIKESRSASGITAPEAEVLFLQNHGFFVSARTKDRVLELHERTVLKLEAFFGPLPAAAELPTPAPGCYFTPDHAVYAGGERANLSEKITRAFHETSLFAKSLLWLIRAKGWEPVGLKPSEIEFLLGMEEEKYRQKFWKTVR